MEGERRRDEEKLSALTSLEDGAQGDVEEADLEHQEEGQREVGLLDDDEEDHAGDIEGDREFNIGKPGLVAFFQNTPNMLRMDNPLHLYIYIYTVSVV